MTTPPGLAFNPRHHHHLLATGTSSTNATSDVSDERSSLSNRHLTPERMPLTLRPYHLTPDRTSTHREYRGVTAAHTVHTVGKRAQQVNTAARHVITRVLLLDPIFLI